MVFPLSTNSNREIEFTNTVRHGFGGETILEGPVHSWLMDNITNELPEPIFGWVAKTELSVMHGLKELSYDIWHCM